MKLFTIGRKGRDYLRREYARQIVGEVSFIGRKSIGFDDAAQVAERVTALFAAGEFDVCTLIYNRFRSVISQVPSEQPLIPAALPAAATEGAEGRVPSSNTSRRRRRSSPRCFPAISRCRSTGRCSRARPASRARA